MKYTLKAVITTAALLTMTTTLALAGDISDKQSGIVVVDAQKVLEGSAAYKKLHSAADEKMKALQKNASKAEEGFKKRYEDIENKKASMSKDEYEKKIQELNKDFEKAQQDLSDKKAKFDSVYGSALQKINDGFIKVVQEEATKAKADFAIQKNQVLYNKDSDADITQKVLDSFNKQTPSVTADFN